MTTVCEDCGRELKDPAIRFCGSCGTPVNRINSQAAQQPPSKHAQSTPPPHIQKRSGSFQKFLVSLAITGVLAIIGLFVYYMRPSRCDSIFEQTAPKLGATLQFLKTKGALIIGRDKIQDLAESSQRIGILCKTCCIAQESGKINAEQFQTCLDTTKRYETQLMQIADTVGQASAARSHGDTQLADQKTTQAIADTKVAVTTVDNAEIPNTTINAARPITEGATVTGSVKANERHFFKFTALGRKTRVILRKRSASGFFANVEIFDHDEKVVASDEQNRDIPVTLGIDTTSGAAYYVEVNLEFDPSSSATHGDYELTVREE